MPNPVCVLVKSTSTHPPFAFGKVLAHLSADRLVDVLAERSVSGDPGIRRQGKFIYVALFIHMADSKRLT